MEIKDYYLILKRNLWLIILITLLFALIAYIFTVTSKPSYQSSVAVEVDRIPSQNQADAPYYQFDNYYSSVVAASLAGNLSEWLSSASTVTQIFEKAGYPLPTSDIKGLSKIFTMGKKGETSSVISATYSSDDREQAEKIILAASDTLKDKVDGYNKADSSAKFLIRADQPVVVEVPKQTILNLVVAAFLGFIISLGIVSIKEALR